GEIISNATDGVIQLGGIASTTSLTLLNGETITNATDGTIALTGNATVSGTLNVTGNSIFSTASSTGLFTLDSIKVSSTGSTVAGLLFGTCTVNFGTSLGAGVATTTNCAATGVTTSHKVFMTPSSLETYVAFNSASSTANDVIQVQVFNTSTSTPATIASRTWSWMAIK
ncbi:MAG: hypothetical protein WC849_00005, partial [Candidatus Paceibacterota bacterium]